MARELSDDIRASGTTGERKRILRVPGGKVFYHAAVYLEPRIGIMGTRRKAMPVN